MPEHDIEMRIPSRVEVVNADVVFEVFSNGEKLGELRISRGSIDWYGAGQQIPASLGWEQFAALMQEWRARH